MRIRPSALLACTALLALHLAACSPSLIPGTKVPDRPENRAVLEVLARYKVAAEALDTQTILSLAAPTYFEQSNSRGATPVDAAGLARALQEKFGRVKTLKMDITVRDLRIRGERAEIDYFLVMHYALDLPAKEKWFPDSDDQRMVLALIGGQWKVASGL
jgi:hypothetical protein